MNIEKDWTPFRPCTETERAPAPRSIQCKEGVADRLRAAAFAEIQAREAFLWAAETFTDLPAGLKEDWIWLAKEEDKHMHWLLDRLADLGFSITERPVSLGLWKSYLKCQNARDFAFYMANAEERGRIAGERFARDLMTRDPVTAKIFAQIAHEEQSHIDLARRYYAGELNP